MLQRVSVRGPSRAFFRHMRSPLSFGGASVGLVTGYAACQQQVRWSSQTGGGNRRHAFQPFSEKDEADLVKVITTKPRHVLKHVRQLVWRTRKRELHFRNTVTQLMIVIQDHLRKQVIDPANASAIMEGVMEECVRMSQHDMAHLLFRAFLRFRKYGCKITLTSLRHLFDSYKGTENTEMMLQLASEMKAEPELRAFCIAAYLFAGSVAEAEELRATIAPEDLTAADIAAVVEGYAKLSRNDKAVDMLRQLPELKRSGEDNLEVIRRALRLFYRCGDNAAFNETYDIMLALQVVPDSATFATILRHRMRTVGSTEEIQKVEDELKTAGYIPDITGNSVIISAFARMSNFGDKSSEEVMLAKIDTLLSSIESRLKQGDPDLDISAAHLRAVIRGYGAAGKADQMKSAWERMQYKGLSNDTRVYNEMIKWLALMGNVKDVLAYKAEMSANEVHADAVTYTWLFRALGKWYPRQVEKYYQEMLDARVRPDGFLYTTLISVFGDLEQFTVVESIRDELRRREDAGTLQVSGLTYASLIRVYSRDIEKVEELYKEAQDKGVADHPNVVAIVLHAFAAQEGGAVRLNEILAAMPVWPTAVYNVLLNMYGRQNDKAKVQELVDRMLKEHVDFNEVTYGTLVTIYGRWKDADKIHDVMELLKQHEGQVSASFYSVLAATYSRMGDAEGVDDAWDDLLSSRLFPDTEVYNQFLTLYGKGHNMRKMQTVMDSMMKQVPPNPLTATTVIDMLGKSGRIADMEQLMSDMNAEKDMQPTIVTYHQVMNAYAKTGDIMKMEKTRDEMVAKDFQENYVTFNILADGYGRAKRFEQLQELCVRRKALNIPMDELGYCVLISAYGRVRLVQEVLRLAEEVRADEAMVTKKVCWTLVDAFCRSNDPVQMQTWMAALPDPTSSDRMSMIAYYARCGMMEKVEEIQATIEGEAVGELSYQALNAIARGYARTGRFDKSVEALHKMRDRNFVPDASTALTLSNLFLKAGLHEQAQQIVQWRRQYAKTHSEEPEEGGVIV